jgi:hypothetical protein
MKIITDDPDWAPKLYEVRALAMKFVRKHGRAQLSGTPCSIAARNGLTVIYYSRRSPLLLTIDAPGEFGKPFVRVLSVEWKEGDAWRVAIETYSSGRWESRLKTMVHPRPWLERWRAVALFAASPDTRAQRRGMTADEFARPESECGPTSCDSQAS